MRSCRTADAAEERFFQKLEAEVGMIFAVVKGRIYAINTHFHTLLCMGRECEVKVYRSFRRHKDVCKGGRDSGGGLLKYGWQALAWAGGVGSCRTADAAEKRFSKSWRRTFDCRSGSGKAVS